MVERTFDVVLYGATGFTGRQTARYFAANAPASLRWAIAGRNRAKLEEVRAQTRAPAMFVADSGEAREVEAMAAATRVVLNTAGPFARYGTPVVDACVRHRVDYVDITGETPWVRGLVDRHHAQAAAAGTRIIPCCGFDSVPSDLGTLMVVDWVGERWGQSTRRVSASFAMRGGGLNGGTWATALDMASPEQARIAADPLLLVPAGGASVVAVDGGDFAGVRFDRPRGVWLTRFAMAEINTRVVRRSAALMAEYGEPYGRPFAYDEAMEVRSRFGALGLEVVLRAGDRLLRTQAGRALAKRLGPAPGQGPSQKAMDRGSIRVRLLAEAADGRTALATMEARGDAGNRVTVTILCEAALALATERERLPGGAGRGGILTPATGLGRVLLERLRAVGFRTEVRPA